MVVKVRIARSHDAAVDAVLAQFFGHRLDEVAAFYWRFLNPREFPPDWLDAPLDSPNDQASYADIPQAIHD